MQKERNIKHELKYNVKEVPVGILIIMKLVL